MGQTNCVRVRVDKDSTEAGRLMFAFSLVCLIAAVIAISINRSQAAVYSFYIFLSFALFGFIVLAVAHFLINRTFDIIDSNGIRRVDRGNELFSISWDNVSSVAFMRSFIYLPIKAYWLTVECANEITIKKSKKDNGSISKTISINIPRICKTQIDSIIPESISRY